MTQILIDGCVLAASYALIALGITLIFSIMRLLNFAHGELFMIGAFMVYYVYGAWHLPFAVGLVVAALVPALIGAGFEKFLFRRVMRIATREENTMLLAVGTAILLDNVALFLFGEEQHGVPETISGVLQIAGGFLPYQRLVVVVMSLALIAVLLSFVQFSRPGRAMRALAQDRDAALLMGVDVDRISMLGFAIGAGLAGLAGGLLVTIQGVNAGIGVNISIKAFIMIMIGGAGVVSGALLGALVLGFAESIGYSLLPGSETYLLIFVALVLFLIVRPQGIMGHPWG
jgi:branched-chain amino acid transport system permease protein